MCLRSSLTADGKRPSTRRKVRFMWLWSQNPASNATQAKGSLVSRNSLAARSTRNRPAVSCNRSPQASRYAVPSHEGWRLTFLARWLTSSRASALRLRVTVPTQSGARCSGWQAALSTKYRSAERSCSSVISLPQNLASLRDCAPAQPPVQCETGTFGSIERPSQSGSNSISICSKPTDSTTLR